MSGRNRSQRASTQRGFTSPPNLTQASQFSSGDDSSPTTSVQQFQERQMIANAFKFMLSQSVLKYPIKRSEIVKHCFQSNARLFDKFFQRVCDLLLSIYEVRVSSIKDEKLGKIFLLWSPMATATKEQLTESQRSDSTLLFIVLSYVYMKGDNVAETVLFEFLQSLGINDTEHEYFGTDVLKLISERFVKQMYLKREKVVLESGNNERLQYSWGNRALLEYSKEDILKSVSKLLKKPPMTFTKQYTEVYGEPNGEVNVQPNGNGHPSNGERMETD